MDFLARPSYKDGSSPNVPVLFGHKIHSDAFLQQRTTKPQDANS